VAAMSIPLRCLVYVDGRKAIGYKDQDWIQGLDNVGLFMYPKHKLDNTRVCRQRSGK